MRLFIINGPFAVGKSTVARLLHEQFPLALLIAIDDVRRFFNRYREFRWDSLQLAEELSCAMARVALSNGRVAIVEGVKVQNAQLEPWVKLAIELSVPLHEVLLWSSRETVLKRAHDRGIAPGSLLSLELVAWAWDSLNTLRGQRPNLIECSTDENTPEQIVRAICRRVDAPCAI